MPNSDLQEQLSLAPSHEFNHRVSDITQDCCLCLCTLSVWLVSWNTSTQQRPFILGHRVCLPVWAALPVRRLLISEKTSWKNLAGAWKWTSLSKDWHLFWQRSVFIQHLNFTFFSFFFHDMSTNWSGVCKVGRLTLSLPEAVSWHCLLHTPRGWSRVCVGLPHLTASPPPSTSPFPPWHFPAPQMEDEYDLEVEIERQLAQEEEEMAEMQENIANQKLAQKTTKVNNIYKLN